MDTFEREVSEKYKVLQKSWKQSEKNWTRVHFILGLSATICAAIVTVASTMDKMEFYLPIFSGVSGLLVATITFLSPASRRKAYSEARSIMRVARLRFETERSMQIKELNDAVEKGHEIVSKR